VEANGKKIGIEVDGPSHFVCRKPTGSTLLKNRQVNTLDEIEVISVPYWEWNKLGKDGVKKQQYLRLCWVFAKLFPESCTIIFQATFSYNH
jgi:hypothetical protein